MATTSEGHHRAMEEAGAPSTLGTPTGGAEPRPAPFRRAAGAQLAPAPREGEHTGRGPAASPLEHHQNGLSAARSRVIAFAYPADRSTVRPMKAVLAAGALLLVLTGCGASDEEVTAAVREVERPLTEQLAERDQELERLQRALRTAENRAEAAEHRISGAEEKAKAAAEQAIAGQTAAVKALEAAVKQKEAEGLAREKAVGTAEAVAAANTFDGDGTYIVGDDIQPGTYKSEGGSPCYWARLGAGGEDIIDNSLGSGPAVVTVRPGDFALEVARCAPFRKTG